MVAAKKAIGKVEKIILDAAESFEKPSFKVPAFVRPNCSLSYIKG